MSFNTQTPEYTDFFEEIPTAEVTAPTVEPATETPTNSEVATTEPETATVETPDETTEQQIPKSRFDEVYSKSKETERQLEEVRAELAKLSESKPVDQPVVDDGPELDPDSQKALEKFLSSKGFVSKAELEQERALETAKIQLQSDVRELTGWAEEKGYPKFDQKSVMDYAKENGIAITSKKSLESAYLAQNLEAITQAAIKAGVNASVAPTATVEKPGAATGKAPSAPETGNKTIQQKIGDVLQSMPGVIT